MRGRRVRASGGEEKAWEEAKAIWRDISNHQWSWPFKEPVDPIKLGIPDYLDVIKHPMDLSTVKNKFTKKQYASINDYIRDMRLDALPSVILVL